MVLTVVVQIRQYWVVQRNTVERQLLTIPRYNEHFGCFSANLLYRGFRYNGTLDITNKFPQSLGTSLNRGSTVNRFG